MSPPLAGCCGYVSVSAETVFGLNAILGGLSLGRGIPFPRCRLILDEDWSECGRLSPPLARCCGCVSVSAETVSGSPYCDDRRF